MKHLFIKVLYANGIEREYMIENKEETTLESIRSDLQETAGSIKKGFEGKVYTMRYGEGDKVIQINFHYVAEVTFEIK